jgi:hypothetical protein
MNEDAPQDLPETPALESLAETIPTVDPGSAKAAMEAAALLAPQVKTLLEALSDSSPVAGNMRHRLACAMNDLNQVAKGA